MSGNTDIDMAASIRKQVAYAEFTVRVWSLVDRLFSGELAIVPAVATPEMLLAGYEAAPQDISDMTCGSEDLAPVWSAMLAQGVLK